MSRLNQGMVEYFAPEQEKENYKRIVDQKVNTKFKMRNNLQTETSTMQLETENSKQFL